jgi:class 3 adenylate cyclase/tetratricopeptide (TPR) repeat protein
MRTLSTYLPQDRLRALAHNESLPDRTSGSALFADISGFTALTESLRESLGPRRGAEELTRHLDAVYSALITEVEKHGGSVIEFAGDAITCWFDGGQQAAVRAVDCAFALQQAMHAFDSIALPNGAATALSLKVAVAFGTARRFVVGDPSIHYMDALAGATVTRTSTAEHLANKGNVLVDESTVDLLGESLTIQEWRTDEETNERFALVREFRGQTSLPPLPGPIDLDDALLRTWIHPQVYQREQSGQPSFLTEFRPCAALFIRFVGIDYDADDAQAKLDAFIRQMQIITSRYEGTFLQLAIGDKGSYVYINFGALNAHEDDARRALKVALELRESVALQLQMGISQGVMRVGAYGGHTRRTYGALGDDVNLAARLMQTATTNEILLSGQVQKAVANDFTFEPRPPLPMKGKAEPLPVFAVTGERKQRAIRLQEPNYALPMVGRTVELQTISEKLDLAVNGQAQVIGIVAEAGMGKSRLAAEVIRLARRKGFAGYGGACQSDAIHTSYQSWKSIWSAFFGVDPEQPLRKQIRSLEGEIEDRAPERVEALPLLGTLLNLDIPENDFTKTLEPKDRKSVLHALLEDCLKAAAKDEPILIIIEDLHWIDALSQNLLEELARSVTTSPICFVLAYRPPINVGQLAIPQLEALPNFTRIELSELNLAECEQAIRAKLAQLYPARTGAVPKQLVDKLMARAQGNPFYLEELLNFLRDRGLDPRDPADLDKIELPDSLHTLILSRVDQLSEREKTTLRVASIVGRLFRADWLTGYYPLLGALPQVKADLDELHTLDITPQDAPEPELAYLFKHIVTHEVTYESLPFAMRAQLHEQLARYLETTYPNDLPIDALAFHYGHSNNLAKKREYLRKSGESAQAAYSNAAAVEYYTQALECSPDEDESVTLHLNLGSIYQLIGEREEAKSHYLQALEIATASQLTQRIVECEIKLGNAWILRSEYSPALEWLEKARTHAAQINYMAGTCDALCEIGIIHWRLANFDTATQYLQQGMDLARKLGDKRKEAYALSVIGQVKAQVGGFAESHDIFEAALSLSREINDKKRIAGTLNNFANTYYYEGEYEMAQKLMEESLEVVREIGDKRGIALALNNLGNIFYLKNDFNAARKYYEESLKLGNQTDDKYTKSIALSSLGITLFRQGHLTEAESHYQESLMLNQAMGDKVGLSLLHCYFGLLALAQGQPSTARKSFIEGLTIAHQSEIKLYVIYNLIGMACVFLAEDCSEGAVKLLSVSDAIARSTGLKIEPELQEPYDRADIQAREKLSATDFHSAWEAGQGLTMEDAVKLALEG